MLYKRDGFGDNPGLGGKMPHLDFRQAFASPSDVVSTVVNPGTSSSASEEVAILRQKRTLATRLPRLHRSDRTTILFAILVFVGGLFCASYFFNGAEILRAAAAWSREFLYPRPSALMANNNRIDIPNPVSDAQTPLRDSRKSNPARGNDTAPFGRSLGSLYPDASQSASGNTGTLAGSSSLLGQLNLPAPGGDALMQAFNQAVENIGRVTSLYANSPVTVVQAPVSQTSQKAGAQLNNVQQTAQKAGAQTTAVQQNVQQRTARGVGASQIRGATSIIGGKDLQQGLGVQGLGSLGGLGDGGAAGGAGGMAGSAAGALGGALGGAGIGK